MEKKNKDGIDTKAENGLCLADTHQEIRNPYVTALVPSFFTF